MWVWVGLYAASAEWWQTDGRRDDWRDDGRDGSVDAPRDPPPREGGCEDEAEAEAKAGQEGTAAAKCTVRVSRDRSTHDTASWPSQASTNTTGG